MARKYKDTFENIRKKKKKFLCFNFEFKGNILRMTYLFANMIGLFIILSYSSSNNLSSKEKYKEDFLTLNKTLEYLNKTKDINSNNNLTNSSYMNDTLNNLTLNFHKPGKIELDPLVIPIIVFFILSLIFYFIVALSDPGKVTDDSALNNSNMDNSSNIKKATIQSGFNYNNQVDDYNNISENNKKNIQKTDNTHVSKHSEDSSSAQNSNNNKNSNLNVNIIQNNMLNNDSTSSIDHHIQETHGDNTIIEYEIKETIPNNSDFTDRENNENKDNVNNSNLNNESSIYEGRYCMECHIDIPLRCKHCRDCDMCIATFDHHCSWTSNCVGEKNKLMFLIYLFFTLILLALSFIHLIRSFEMMGMYKTSSVYISDNFILLTLTLLIGLLIIFVWTLLKFQVYLALVNQTTWENYSWHKIQYMISTTKSQISPFNKGSFNNLKYVMCIGNVLKRSSSRYILWRKEVDLEKLVKI